MITDPKLLDVEAGLFQQAYRTPFVKWNGTAFVPVSPHVQVESPSWYQVRLYQATFEGWLLAKKESGLI